MSEAGLWLSYATAIIPSFLLRRMGGVRGWLCVAAGGLVGSLIWLICSALSGANFDEPGLGFGAFIAAAFSAMFGGIGLAIAHWNE